MTPLPLPLAGDRVLVRHERWGSLLLGWMSAASLAIYVGLVVTQSGDTWERVRAAGWAHLFLAAALVTLLLQLYLSLTSTASERRLKTQKQLQLANTVLESTIKLLSLRKKNIIYRALITVHDPRTGMRTTIGGANFRVDPESTLSVPTGFGIAGEAFAHGRCALGDIPDDIRGIDAGGEVVEGIWSQVRSVVAFPLMLDNQPPKGTINIDANKFLHEAGLDDRDLLEALAVVAALISTLLLDTKSEVSNV